MKMYIAPEIVVVDLSAEEMLAQSGQIGNGTEIGTGGGDGGSEGQPLPPGMVKSHSAWDDEW